MTLHLIPQTVQHELLAPNLVRAVEAITGGLSGANIWRCKSELGWYALRQWPAQHPSKERLTLIHHAMRIARESDVLTIPRILTNRNGLSFTSDGSRFWELTQWMPGSADYLEAPSTSRLTNAMRSLATLHNAWSAAEESVAVSPTVAERVPKLEGWIQRIPSLHSPIADLRLHELAVETVRQLIRLGPSFSDSLQSIQRVPVKNHFVLRDIWSDHVLFIHNEVTGIIDFGACRVDEPATDVARLLGSLEPQDGERWRRGLAAYLEMNPAVDPQRVQLLDRVSVLLAALQWLEWLVIERRTFAAPLSQLLSRWQGLLRRLTTSNWSASLL